MAMNEKQVLVRFTNKVEGLGELQKQKDVMGKINSLGKEGTAVFEKQNGRNIERIQVDKRLNEQGMEQYRVRQDLIRQGPQFKMEYLGVMFAGMALQRTMAGLTQTAKEWMGIGEIMSTSMGVVMLPAMQQFLEQGVLPLSEALMNLPESTQMIIGVTSLAFEAVGGAMMAIGQFGLAANALENMFPNQISKGGEGLILIKGAVGLTLTIASLATFSAGFSEGDFLKEVSGALGMILGTAFVASAAGAGAVTAGTIGILTVGVGLAIVYTIKSKKIIDKMKEDPNYDLQDIVREEGATGVNALTLGAAALMDRLPKGSKVRVTDFSPINIIKNLFGGSPSAAVGRQNIPENGMYMLHQGETVLRKDQAGSGEQQIIINYNITASSMREFENMLRESERRITSDIRRQAR